MFGNRANSHMTTNQNRGARPICPRLNPLLRICPGISDKNCLLEISNFCPQSIELVACGWIKNCVANKRLCGKSNSSESCVANEKLFQMSMALHEKKCVANEELYSISKVVYKMEDWIFG